MDRTRASTAETQHRAKQTDTNASLPPSFSFDRLIRDFSPVTDAKGQREPVLSRPQGLVLPRAFVREWLGRVAGQYGGRSGDGELFKKRSGEFGGTFLLDLGTETVDWTWYRIDPSSKSSIRRGKQMTCCWGESGGDNGTNLARCTDYYRVRT